MDSGLIIKAQSGFFTVHTDDGPVVCKLRGKLKQERRTSDLATVGDRVTISRLPDGSGIIESVADRVHVLARRKPSPKGRADPSSGPRRRGKGTWWCITPHLKSFPTRPGAAT